MKKCWILMILLASLITFGAACAEVQTDGLFSYIVNEEGHAALVDFDWAAFEGNNLFVPDEMNGCPVTVIRTQAFELSEGEQAPYGINIALPQTLQVLEEKAFFDLNVGSVNIPDTLTEMGYGVFASQYTDFSISPSHPVFAVIDGSLYHKQRKELLRYNSSSGPIPNGIRSIGDYACMNAYLHVYHSREAEYLFPSTLEKIGDHAFEGATVFVDQDRCENLLFLLPETVTEIGQSAFRSAEFLVELDKKDTRSTIALHLPEHIQTIGDNAFEDIRIELTYGLNYDNMNESVLSRAKEKAASWNNMISVAYYLPYVELWLPDSLETLGRNAFAMIDGGLYEVYSAEYNLEIQCIIPQASPIRTIPSGTFACTESRNAKDSYTNSEHVTSVRVEAPVSVIEDHAADHTRLYLSSPECTEYLGSGNVYIGFDGVESFPAWMTEIPTGLNPWANALPDTVTSIASQAYSGIRKDFVLGPNLSFIAPDAFAEGSSFLVNAGTYAEQWCKENHFMYMYNYEETEDDLSWLND